MIHTTLTKVADIVACSGCGLQGIISLDLVRFGETLCSMCNFEHKQCVDRAVVRQFHQPREVGTEILHKTASLSQFLYFWTKHKFCIAVLQIIFLENFINFSKTLRKFLQNCMRTIRIFLRKSLMNLQKVPKVHSHRPISCSNLLQPETSFCLMIGMWLQVGYLCSSVSFVASFPGLQSILSLQISQFSQPEFQPPPYLLRFALCLLSALGLVNSVANLA